MRAREFINGSYKTPNRNGQSIFEINFNDPKLAKNALSSSISCGFEAETVWPDIEAEIPEDLDFYSDYIQNLLSTYEKQQILNAFDEWAVDLVKRYKEMITKKWVQTRAGSAKYAKDFIKSNKLKSEFSTWAKENNSTNTLKYIKQKRAEDFPIWLTKQAEENDQVTELAYAKFEDDYNVNDYVDAEWGSLAEMFDSFNVDALLVSDKFAGVVAVAEEVKNWSAKSSEFKEIRAGGYHQGANNTEQDYWRVEEDSSIEIEGQGSAAEIISPVFSTPVKMLDEMKSLFNFMVENDVETNKSTGLHVTMSWTGEKVETNQLKLAILLGDKYLLGKFGRLNNSFTPSQQKNIEAYLEKIRKNINDQSSLENLETELQSALSSEKYSAVNFKSITNEDGNNLIEFRIAGGKDYHTKYSDVVKTVTRYAVVMNAAHDPAAYRTDYIKALFRVIKSGNTVSSDEEKATLDLYKDLLPKKPITNTVQQMISKKNYTTALQLLATAYKGLELAQKQSSRTVTESAEINALLLAQTRFAGVVAMLALDLARGQNRQQPSATTISSMRQALRDFDLDYDKLWKLVLESNEYRVDNNYSDPFKKQDQIHIAISKLFKAKIGGPMKPAMTISYDPNTEAVFMETELLDASTFTDVELKPEHFKVINLKEYSDAKNAKAHWVDLNSDIAVLQQTINATNPESDLFLVKVKQLRDEQEKAATLYNVFNAFKKKYGFSPDKYSESKFNKVSEGQKLNLTKYDGIRFLRSDNKQIIP